MLKPVVFEWTLMLSLVLCCSLAAHAQSLRGIVRDISGSGIPSAEITVTSAAGTLRTIASPTGQFAFNTVAQPATVTATSKGFSTATATWIGQPAIELVLRPAPVSEQIVVTASRSEAPLGETTASLTRIAPEELHSTPFTQIDDVLRQVPGFTLFRRSGSRSANPTSQGVSLRGLGASGASRALVLYDGVPLNDPFGGWVYWDRVPLTAVDSVEVLRGGASSLYGSGALAGIVNILRKNATGPEVSFDASAGNEDTGLGTLKFSDEVANWDITGVFEGMRTDGYIPVRADLRGRADATANVRYGNSRVRVGHGLGKFALFAAGDLFNESRQNGTVLQTNNTRVGEGIAGIDGEVAGGTLQARVYGSAQRFNQTFSSISADRNSETLVRVQSVPAQQVGVSAQWVRPLSSTNVVVIGTDMRQLRGHSDDTILSRTGPIALVSAGGQQRLIGAFAADTIQIRPRLHVSAAVRVDSWNNYDASSTTTSPISAPVNKHPFPSRGSVAFSPSLGAAFQLTRLLSLTGSAYGAFRSPTLNELYRTFRLGNLQTLANDALRAERLRGAETGFNIGSGPLFLRTTFFWNSIQDAIGNRTLTSDANPITRERQNLGLLQSRGFEFELQSNLPRHLSVRTGYEYSHSTVARSFEPALVGRVIPQVPRHAVSTAVRYLGPRWSVTVVGRYVGRQYDDDLNQFVLPGYFTADVMGSYRIAEPIEVFVACENLLNRGYEIGRTPVPTLGAPRFLRAGVRLHWTRAKR